MAMMVLIGGCKDAAQVSAAPEPPEVQVTQVIQKDVPIYSEWVGTTVGYVTAHIRARITGYLMSQQYTEGSFVKTGDLLFRIDPRPYQAVVDQDEANLGQAQAQLEQAKAQLAEANAQIEQAKAQVRADRLFTYVQLYRALGGGWNLTDAQWSGPQAKSKEE